MPLSRELRHTLRRRTHAAYGTCGLAAKTTAPARASEPTNEGTKRQASAAKTERGLEHRAGQGGKLLVVWGHVVLLLEETCPATKPLPRTDRTWTLGVRLRKARGPSFSPHAVQASKQGRAYIPPDSSVQLIIALASRGIMLVPHLPCPRVTKHAGGLEARGFNRPLRQGEGEREL